MEELKPWRLLSRPQHPRFSLVRGSGEDSSRGLSSPEMSWVQQGASSWSRAESPRVLAQAEAGGLTVALARDVGRLGLL